MGPWDKLNNFNIFTNKNKQEDGVSENGTKGEGVDSYDRVDNRQKRSTIDSVDTRNISDTKEYGRNSAPHSTDGVNKMKSRNIESYNKDFAKLSNEVGALKSQLVSLISKMDWVVECLEWQNKQSSNREGKSISEVLERLDKLIEQQNVLDSQQEIIKRQHESMLKFNDDVLYKTQKGLILEMIGLADQVRMILQNKYEDDSYDLMQGLKELEESIEASLSNNSVRRYSETESDATLLNRRRQVAVGNEVTSNPQKDGHYRSVAPGYEWCMPYLVVNSEVKLLNILKENQSPQAFSFVIRPEEVMKLRYSAPQSSDSLDNPSVTNGEIHNKNDDGNLFIEF